MKIAVTGSTGSIGRALVPALTGAGHEVTRLVRRPAHEGELTWRPGEPLAPLDGFGAVVHLAGVGIADKRWSPAHKRAVLDSRVAGTSTIAAAVAATDPMPVLLSASAIGWYGDTGDRAVTESEPSGSGYLAEICRAWEEATRPAVDAGARVATLRTGLVCSPDTGLLQRMLPLFRLGLGGRLGSGRQYWSWISQADTIGAIVHLLGHDVAGPVNLTGPDPVTNAEFTATLGRVLGRPTPAPVPAFALRLVVGEFADEGALISQRILPGALTGSGYQFRHATVEAALRHATGR